MQLKIHMITIEDLVPEDHFLRKLESALNLSFVYEETESLYSRKYGRPPIDPVMIVKYLLVGYLYGIPSERQIEQRIQTDVALRWYLGLDLFDRVPDHSTISQLRRRKPTFRKIFRRLFEEVVRQCIEKDLVSGRVVATDSTHVKANASMASEELVETPDGPGAYWKRLDAYEEEGRKELERRRGKKLRPGKQRRKCIKKCGRRSHKRVSRTDPEAGHMNRPGKPVGQHYLSHQTLDTDHGIILDVAVTPGDVNDSVPYLDQMEYIHKNVVPVQTATADAAYDFPLAHRVLDDMGISFFVRPQVRPNYSQTTLQPDAFHYDKEQDIYICPNGKTPASGMSSSWSKRLEPAIPPGQEGVPGVFPTGTVYDEQAARPVGRTQLLPSSGRKEFLQAKRAGVRGRAPQAADLVRRYFRRSEARP